MEKELKYLPQGTSENVAKTDSFNSRAPELCGTFTLILQ